MVRTRRRRDLVRVVAPPLLALALVAIVVRPVDAQAPADPSRTAVTAVTGVTHSP